MKLNRLSKIIDIKFKLFLIIINTSTMYKQNLREEHSKRIKALKKLLFDDEPIISKSFSNHQETVLQDLDAFQKLLKQEKCARCSQFPIKTNCATCRVNLCSLCDKFIHQFAKFTTHQRKPLSGQNQERIECQGLMEIKINEADPKQANENTQILIENLNANQKWNKIIYEIQNKFDEFFTLLKEKKEDVIAKLEKKKEQQIKSYIESSKEAIARKKIDQNPKIKASQCEHQDECGRCLGKIEINSSYFQELKLALEKIQLKNVVTKKICQNQQEYKKKMKISLLTNMQSSNIPTYYSGLRSPKNTFDLLSPVNLGFRSPKNTKLSESFAGGEKKNNTSIKQNEQESEMSRSKKETKQLLKVKSQKFNFKPKNIDLSTRSPLNRSKKLELMI